MTSGVSRPTILETAEGVVFTAKIVPGSRVCVIRQLASFKSSAIT